MMKLHKKMKRSRAFSFRQMGTFSGKTSFCRYLPLFLGIFLFALLTGCGRKETQEADPGKSQGQMALSYATEFSVDEYQNGIYLLTISGEDSFVLREEGADPPQELSDQYPVITIPCSNIYLAASSAMDFFRQLKVLDRVRYTSTTRENWSLPEVIDALDSGAMRYVGSYSQPDYEQLLQGECALAIESTMITHSPKVKDALKECGIPVIEERSSYEDHPLGRLEWIKLYGLLTGKLREAVDFFDQTCEELAPILREESAKDGPSVAYFSINSAGTVTVRKPGDYLSRMISMAGGQYAFADLVPDDNNLSTMNLQMEAIYAGAVQADILIYNSTIDAALTTREELLGKSELLADFPAFQEGNVWCTGKDVFQQVTGLGEIWMDFHKIIEDPDVPDEELRYLYRLK